MNSNTVEDQLDDVLELLRGIGQASHKEPANYDHVVHSFIRLSDQGLPIRPDEIERWAVGRGWTLDDAHDLAEMAQVVDHTLRALRKQGRI